MALAWFKQRLDSIKVNVKAYISCLANLNYCKHPVVVGIDLRDHVLHWTTAEDHFKETCPSTD